MNFIFEVGFKARLEGKNEARLEVRLQGENVG